MKALITGICGQDGSYLAEWLLEKGYSVYGLMRRKATFDLGNAKHLKDKVHFIYGDMTDLSSLVNAMKVSDADEVYNLAGQSFVGISWEQPRFTADVNAIGVLNMLDAVRIVNPSCRFYQASTSEMFGLVQEVPQTERTPFYPRSPYGVSKLYGHWITKNYRESYGAYACSGILFNHESPRRGLEFVTRKITDSIARIKKGESDVLKLGNLSSKRDWGYAGDYVKGMWLMLQQDKPDDYILSSGETHEIREFAQIAFARVGIEIVWKGKEVEERGVDVKTNKTLIEVDRAFFRPAEVEMLLGNPQKAVDSFGWEREVDFPNLVKMMVDADLVRYGL